MTVAEASRASLEAETLMSDFESCKIDPGDFNHRTHVLLAWLYLEDRPLVSAIEAITGGLKRLTKAVGAEDKYHETVTWAFVLLIHDRRCKLGAGHCWREFEEANMDVLSSKPSPLGRYYRPETLSSDLAKQVFLMPDLVA